MTHSAPTKLPPGPPLPLLVQSALMLRYGLGYLTACQRRYGDVFTLRQPLVGTVVYVADPAAIKSVFVGDPRVFHGGEGHQILRGVLGDSSLFVIDEDEHRDRRRLMMPAFHRDAVARQTAAMAEIAAANIAGWPVGKNFPVAPKTAEIALEVILRTVVGATDPARLAALRKVVPQLLYLSPWETLAIANPKLRERRPWRALRRRFAQVDDLLYAEIADRRADPDLADRTDALAMLVRAADDDGRTMSDRELRDQLLTLILAGHETTATSLAWALERLTRHPAILAKAVRAADASAAGDPAGDEYLEAVVKETLRVRPVIFSSGRVLTEPAEVGGYLLPAGITVDVSMGLVHASAELYPDPERFNPDRMIDATLKPTTYLPFGGGVRRCLGATFATVETHVVLREVLRRVELCTTTAPDEKQKLKHVTFVPHRGARIELRAIRDIAPESRSAEVPGCPAHSRGSASSGE
ncbi:cytochrome P450 [Mycobacterium kyorinense]|uniref:Cytochrome P450 n=1 Tax=Mycobacterium kyorinense TaxID=487514 RepID=A0A1A2ZQA0_9MYCO|nr:cytochrome P450 [Mycobacterium kyorinense]OBI51863.1 cytochrome P450 [Mycobacterium kyorinense]